MKLKEIKQPSCPLMPLEGSLDMMITKGVVIAYTRNGTIVTSLFGGLSNEEIIALLEYALQKQQEASDKT